VQRYIRPLYERVRDGDIDPSFVVSHRMTLDDAPQGFEMHKHKQDEFNKVILRP
jgi:threonine dehydrogenase-like Zn-dependent dehydrogenase